MLLMDHLPECPAGYVADLCTTDIDPVLQEPSCNHCVGQGCICICNRLRACEQRVLDAALKAVESVSHWTDIDIALALPWSVRGEKWIAKDLALAAIDALRRESDV